MISLKTHGIVDYVLGLFLMACPSIFGMSYLPEAKGVFYGLGLFLVLYSLFTQYPASIVKLVPISAHMVLDILDGLFLILAPTLLGYRAILTPGQYALHFVLGVFFIGFVGVTRFRSEIGISNQKATLDVGHLHFQSKP